MFDIATPIQGSLLPSDTSLIRLADVVLDITTSGLDSTFTYSIPETEEFASLDIGRAVKVPFGKREVLGFVCAIRVGESFAGLKSVSSVLTPSLFNETALELAKFLSVKYVAPLISCVHLFVPPGGIKKMTSKTKTKKSKSLDAANINPDKPKLLNADQSLALNTIIDAYNKHNGQVVLIDGVTGSGKTEVYLQAISHALNKGKNAIMLVPEISLTPQTVARLHARFGDTVAVLHSRMSQGERFNQWKTIKSGFARVVVGARSALFAPLANVGLIVIDEEHESTYKQESAPRYDARDVAAWMVKQNGATLVLGSATPSIESQYFANKQDNWSYRQMPTRVNDKPLPDIEIINMGGANKRRSDKRTHILARELFSSQLEDAIVETLSNNQKVVLFLNQRGFARFVLCSDCGFVARCKLCSTTLTYHVNDNNLVCHHCGYTVASPVVCPACNSHYLMKQGFGTERIENELRAFLDLEFGSDNNISVVRMDADTTSTKGAHEKLLAKFASSERGVLLGTQMIAKGLDFDDVTLVGVINADTQLNLPDFRASERTFNLIEQVAGRAGRGKLAGKVMVQTYQSDNVAITSAASYDRDMFLRAELPKRKILGYPPYVLMANVLVWGQNSNDVATEIKKLHELTLSTISDSNTLEFDVLAPVPCVFERIRNVFRWHFVVKCKHNQDISELLNKVNAAYKRKKGINVAFDVNPQDLL